MATSVASVPGIAAPWDAVIAGGDRPDRWVNLGVRVILAA